MTRVTIVMPVYNGERYIAEAVHSAFDSRFPDFELLVIDDGSRDASVAEATRAAAGDARLRIVTVPHGGVAAARNAALREARGELIANLDADDVMFPERLERQVDYLDRHPECVAVGCRVIVIDSAGRFGRVLGRFFEHDEIDRALLEGNGGAMGNAVMFRLSALRSIDGYTDHLRTTGEDHDLYLRLAEMGRLAVLPEILNRYRVHDANVSLQSGADRRLPITLATLERAFARRGITNRRPAKLEGTRPSLAERWRDEALSSLFRRNRSRALVRVLGALVLNAADPATRSAARVVIAGARFD